MKKIECPLCKSNSSLFKNDKNTDYYRCSNCKTLFLSPMPTVSEMMEYADDHYSQGVYLEYVKARDLKIRTFEDRIAQVKKYLKPNKVIRHLDIGCAAGFMIEVGLLNGFDSYGVEFSAEAISYAKDPIKNRITQGDVNNLDVNNKFDIITCFDIIEHVQNPAEFLKSLKRVLSPNGILMITTPDTEHFIAKIMGKSWSMLQPKQHTYLFSKKSLENSLTQAGLTNLAQSSAYKVITYDYIAGQLSELNPMISSSMKLFGKVIPKSLREKSIKLNISEFLTVAQNTDN